MESKIDFIQDVLKKNNLRYIEINNPISINLIYTAFKHGVLDEANTDGMVCFYYGISFAIKNDHKMAFHWYKKSSDSGNSFGMCKLGNCYISGNESDGDLVMAVSLYRKSAELGNSYAMTQLGYCYMQGHGVTSDDDMAFLLHQKSAELGNYTGMYYLGNHYYEGKGVVKNYIKAFKLFKLSADGGVILAQDALNKMYNEKNIMIEILSALVTENNKLVRENKTLVDENEHLRYCPGLGYEEAMRDYTIFTECNESV